MLECITTYAWLIFCMAICCMAHQKILWVQAGRHAKETSSCRKSKDDGNLMIGSDRFPDRVIGRNAVGSLTKAVKYAYTKRPYRETLDSRRRGRSPMLQTVPTPEFLSSWRAHKKGNTGHNCHARKHSQYHPIFP